MIQNYIIILFICISAIASAKPLCANDNLRSSNSFADFCITVSPSAEISREDLDLLSSKLLALKKRFPKLLASAIANGYQNIIIAATEVGESGGTVLGEILQNPKALLLYSDFFKADKNLSMQLPFAITDIVLVHELLHAFDNDNSLVTTHFKKLGWDTIVNTSNNGFKVSDTDQISNIWIQNTDVSSIKNELGPLLSIRGPWFVYLEARNRVKKFGYPSIYSILGGPTESFAEIGAYIACDPTASSYIPSETIKLFEQNILQ